MNEVKKIMQQAAALADDELITQPLKQQGSWPECVHLLNKKALWGLKWMRIHFKNNDLYRNLNTIEIKK